MDHRIALIAAALAAATSAAETTPATAGQAGIKCFGMDVHAHQNDCARPGVHSCAGQANRDNDPGEFKYVGSSGLCADMKGKPG